MGLYDREYYRGEQRSGFSLGGDRTMVTNLILVNVAVYLLELLAGEDVANLLSVKADLFRHPWDFWQLLTAGFVHDPGNIWHIGMNMFGLWMFGRDVEGIYGRAEFLRIYLALVVLSSLAWVLVRGTVGDGMGSMMGASGAVTGVLVLFVMHFPKRLFYIWGVLPVPAWALATVYVVTDALGFASSQNGPGGGVAYEAHLAGALGGFLYFQSGLNLGRFVPSLRRLPRLSNRPKLRVHDPQSDVPESLEQRVDRILDKVAKSGIDSLTPDERRMLEDASRRYQRRRS